MPFPEQMELVRELVVNDHVALDDEPLLFAVYYKSQTAPNEECLFEVARNFGYDVPGEDKHIFQIQFGRTPNFLLPPEGRLRLSITNPAEFKQAVMEGWPEIQDIQAAIRSGDYKELYLRPNDQEARELWALLERQPVAA